MTVSEAIKHSEEVANKCDMLAEQSVVEQAEHHHHKCAAEHRQLAEWLKDYKRLKEQEPVLDKIRAEIEALNPEPTAYDVVDGNPIKDVVWETLADVLKIIDKYKTESEDKR